MEIKNNSNAFYEYVQNFKDEMVAEAEGKEAKKNAFENSQYNVRIVKEHYF